MRLLFTGLFGCLLLISALQADIIEVPGDQPTIQAGIDAAVHGDVVLVSDGTYEENIYFRGKAITVASLFWQNGNPDHITNTIIDGSQPADPDRGSTVMFLNGEDTTSVLYGFTVTGGTGSRVHVPPFMPERVGGGILIRHGARIVHNIVRDNNIRNLRAVGGGIAAYCGPGKAVIIEQNRVVDNRADAMVNGGSYSFAAGIALWPGSYSRISDNTIMSNTAVGSAYANCNGSGLSMDALPNDPVGEILVTGNLIADNVCYVERDNVWNAGAGMLINRINMTTVTVRDNYFVNNRIIHSIVAGHGGGLAVLSSKVALRHNVFRGNVAGNYGGGLAIGDATVTEFFNNIFEDNAGRYGGGMYIQETTFQGPSQPVFRNNTFWGNQATERGGGMYVDLTSSGSLSIVNTILWGDRGPSGVDELYIHSGAVGVQYSDIEGLLWPGPGNISEDPQLMDTVYTNGRTLHACLPSTASGCVDGGDPNLLWLDPVDPANPGQALWPAMGGLRADMGAYGGRLSKDMAVGVKPAEAPSALPDGFVMHQNYPNPFNPQTNVEFGMPNAEWVTLTVYDLLGRRVKTLVNEKLAAGSYTAQWDGCTDGGTAVSSGLYIYTLQAGQFIESRKMLLLH